MKTGRMKNEGMQVPKIGIVGLAMLVALLTTGAAAWAADSTWTNAVNGSWSEAAKWLNGVPDLNNANLTAGNGSYTVTVDSALSAPATALTITNNSGNTTRLDINAAGFAVSNGILTFGRGALVSVNTNGEMTYPGINSTYPFISLTNGGEWQVNGGKVNFADIMGNNAGRSYINVGNASTGRLTITSGLFDFRARNNITGTNSTVMLRVGYNTDARGSMVMTGGRAVIYTYSTGGSVSFEVGNGTRAYGEVLVTNDAVLIVSNLVTVGTSSGTGIMTLAGNSSNRANGRIDLGYSGGRGEINLRDNAYLSCLGAYVGRAGCTGILNIAGGRYYSGEATSIGYGENNNTSYGELNISGGILELDNYGVYIGNAQGITACSATGVVNLSGSGLIKINNNISYGNQTWYPVNGLVVGKAASPTNINPRSSAYCRFNMSGGTITNAGGYAVGVWPGGTGEVYQTAGNVWQRTYQLVVGWCGGSGLYSMSGGTFWSDKSVFVGGIFTNDIVATYKADPTLVYTNPSSGTIRINGGSIKTTADLYVGRCGAGTVTMGSNGTLTVGNLIMTNNTSSKLRFEVARDGAVGQLVITNKLYVYPGAKLEVYVPENFIKGPTMTLTLATYATNVGSFADVTVSNYPNAAVTQTMTNLQVSITGAPRGSVISIR